MIGKVYPIVLKLKRHVNKLIAIPYEQGPVGPKGIFQSYIYNIELQQWFKASVNIRHQKLTSIEFPQKKSAIIAMFHAEKIFK